MTDMKQHLDEGTIHAWLDGELPPDESARVEAHATTCSDCASLVAEARGLIAASSRILSSLDAVPAGVVPGSDRGVDQLAVLRARRTAASRRWWRDARVVAAASLVFMAGTVSVVWRASTNQLELDQAAPVAPVVVDVASPAANAPSAATTSAPASTRDGEPKSAAPERGLTSKPQARSSTPATPTPSAAPMPVVVTGVGAASNQRTEPAAKIAPPPTVAANEARRSDAAVGADRRVADSVRANPQVSADSLARQRAALSQRFEAQRTDSSSMGARQSTSRSRALAAPPAGSAAGLRLAEAASSQGACYQLQVVPPGGQPSALADTVQLLDEVVPERSDPLWRRARKVGASATDPVMTWRDVDSVTVELRTRTGVASNLVQFLSRSVAGLASDRNIVIRSLPNVVGQAGVQAALAVKVACPG